MATWTPAEITTALWLDADDASTITTVSGNVSAWADKSGNGRDATQSAAGDRPAYSATGLNGRPTISFAADFLSLDSPIAVAAQGNASFFAVVGRSVSTHLIPLGSSSGVGGYPFYWFNNNRLYLDMGGTSNTGGFTAANTSTGAFVVTTVRDVANRIMRLDGINQTLGTLLEGSAQNLDWIGRRNSPGEITTGNISEIIYVESTLSQSDQQRVEGYLAWKWGLQAKLPVDHPYKNTAPGANRISGFVQKDGQPLPFAKVLIHNANTNVSFKLTADANGFYDLKDLPNDDFFVTAFDESDSGYRPLTHRINLT